MAIQDEVLNAVSKELSKELRSAAPAVRTTMNRNVAAPVGAAGAGTAGWIGGLCGAHLGIAGFFGAIPATWPLAIAAALIGGLAAHDLGSRIDVGGAAEAPPAPERYCRVCGQPVG